MDSSGKLVLAGNRWRSTSATDVALARYTAAGSLDASFGIGGVSVVSLAPQLPQATATDVAIDEHGRYVVSVYATTADYVTQRDFVAMRCDVNGQLDAAFGVGGVASVHVDRDDEAKAVALDPAGNIVVAGSTGLNATRKTAVLRILP